MPANIRVDRLELAVAWYWSTTLCDLSLKAVLHLVYPEINYAKTQNAEYSAELPLETVAKIALR